jgi:hypothetical protein
MGTTTARPANPTPKAIAAARLRLAMLADDHTVDDARKLSKLIIGGHAFDDPAVVAVADRLRTHVERLISPAGGRA